MSSPPEKRRTSLVDTFGVQGSMKGARTINQAWAKMTVAALPGHVGRRSRGRRSSAGAVLCLAAPGQDRAVPCRCIFWWPPEHNRLRDAECLRFPSKPRK